TESAVPRRTLLWTAIATLVLVLGLIASLIALKRAQNWVARQKTDADSPRSAGAGAPSNGAPVEEGPFAKAGFEASEVTFEQTAGSSLVYAVGTISNRAQRQRFGVKIEIELLDGSGEKLGTAKDYTASLEPSGTWRFKALVVDPKAVSARISAITEDQ